MAKPSGSCMLMVCMMVVSFLATAVIIWAVDIVFDGYLEKKMKQGSSP